MPALEFTGTERFQVRSRLGAGGMGVVYHAFDVERQADVALKVLQRLDADGIYKLKAEFRALSDVSHPNLVGLYELVSEGEHWFFTMERLEGVDFLDWVRHENNSLIDQTVAPTLGAFNIEDLTVDACVTDGLPGVKPVVRARRTADPVRLRPALQQLARGISAIHSAGKLHRDIKPSNAMVTPEARVVLLDFGLVSDTTARTRESQTDNAISGTPAYMAPEQASGVGVSAASDWYAVGVMMYEALTGQLPFSGTWFQLLEAKLNGTPMPPQSLVPEAPTDLSNLCIRLLQAKPENRPGEHEIMRTLGLRVDSGVIGIDEESSVFVGRTVELAQLLDAQHACSAGHPVLVHVTGPAGIGKTATLQQMLADFRSEATPPLVLSGRCYERETVPYKAFDSLVDALTRHLLRLSEFEVAQLVPRDVGALARIFPVLRRVPAIDRSPMRDVEIEDKRGQRRHAFAAFQELLRRMSRERGTVVVLDDLQWGDVDSMELLAALLEPPDPPRVLFVLSWRDTEPTPGVAALHRLAGGALPGVDVRQVALGPLSRDECQQLAVTLLGNQDAHSERRADVIVKESQGSPLFLVELARFRDAWSRGQATVTNPEATLEQVLGARVEQLAKPARRLLDLVAVAGKPIRQRHVLAAAALGKEERAALQQLRAGHSVRTSGGGDADLIETYHNAIRAVVIRLLRPDELRSCHAALARVIDAPDADGQLDVDALAYHYLGAGDDERGLDFSLQAARRAHAVYANHDAIRHYDAVLRILTGSPRADRQALLAAVQEEAAEACRQAGEYGRATHLLQACLDRATTPLARADFHVGLGRVLQEKGDTGGAIEQLETALRLFGKRPPGSLTELVAQAAGQYALHLLYSWLPGLAGRRSDDATLQKRADTMFSLIRIYYFIDVGKVVWAGVTTIVMSRRFRRDADVALAYSFYGVLLFGMGMLDRSKRWCERAVSLARKSGDPVAEAVATLRLGTQAVFANDLPRADRLLRESVKLFKEIGEMWELQTGLMLLATSCFMAADYRAAEPLYEEMGATGKKLNAIMHQGWCLAWAPYCRYLTGREDAATTRASLDRALVLSAQARDIANQCAALQHACNLAVREGQVEEAAGLALRTYEIISRYLVQVPFLQIALVDAAEAALFALENGAGSVSRGTLVRIVKRGTAKALRMGGNYTYLLGPALRVRARWLAFHQGETAAEPVFRKAIEVLEGTPNRWETGVAYLDAAQCLPAQRAQMARQARRIFEEIGVVAELRRMDRDPALGRQRDR